MQTLRQAGYSNIEALPTALEGEELKARIRDVHFIGIRSRTRLNAEVLEAAQRLVAIGCFCIGTNQVDLNQALLQAIPVFNAPFSNTRSVAELVLAEAILLLRGIPEKNALAHRGGWLKSASNASRDSRQAARHHRLWQHRHPARCHGRVARHEGPFLRRGQQVSRSAMPFSCTTCMNCWRHRMW